MDSLSDEVSRDIASDWVENLRSRFIKMGLSSVTNSDVGIDSANCSGPKAGNDSVTTDPNCPRIQANTVYDSRPGVFSKNTISSSERSELRSERSCSSLDFEIKNDDDTTSDDSRILEMRTSRAERNTSLDLERLREKRLTYFRRVVRNAPEDGSRSSLWSEHSREHLSLQFNDLKLNNSTVSGTRSFADEPEREDEYYLKTRGVSTSSSCEKKSWDCDRFDEVRSPEIVVEPRLKSNEDDIEHMLDWWGLNDPSTKPELHRYFSMTRSTFDRSRKTVRDSENSKSGPCLDRCGEAADADLQANLKDSFHVFPVGFDKDDAELGQHTLKSGILEDLHCSGDEDSDFTLDNPILKSKAPRIANGLYSGNLPQNSSSCIKSRLSLLSTSPVPQIKGSLYFEFSGGETVSEEVPQCPDLCTTANNDELVNWRIHHRPRSLSQPSAVKDCCKKFESIFCDGEEDNPSIVTLYSCREKPEGAKQAISSKHGVDNFEDIGAFDSLYAGKNNIRSKDEGLCYTENILVSPQSNDEHGNDKFKGTICVCPECEHGNNSSANWCIECGLAMVNVKPIKLVQNMKKQSQSNSLSSEEVTQSLEPKKCSSQGKSVADSVLSQKNSRKNYSKQFKQDGRRWEKSNLAWNTCRDSHLSKPPSVKNFRNKSKSNFAASERLGNSVGRPRSASCKNSGKMGIHSPQNHDGPCSVAGSWPRSHKVHDSKCKRRHEWNSTRSCEMKVKDCKTTEEVKPTKKNDLALGLSALDDYAEITEMIRSNRGNPIPYLCLPDEIILRIFNVLSHTDLARCSQVCRQFGRISQDECLWKTIVLEKNHNMCDEFLEKIGSRKPVSLSLIRCRGNLVTSRGLRELFRRCAENLEELNFSGCNGGQLIGESILLHVALRCSKLRSVDASWSNVGDNGIEALVQNVHRLECLCLNGCQAITDHSLKIIADKHGESLRTFEIFGCFNVSAAGIKRLGQKCPHLQTLNLGQCYKITSAAIGQLVSHLESIVNLDLRGCKQARDACVKTIAKHCPHLVNLVLANCPFITDVAMAEIATNLPSVRCLDVCGCVKVTDHGVKALARSCSRLNYLDLSSTSITQKSVMLLANYCSQNLESLKLSFCVEVTDDSVSRLVKHCKRMTTLHLYGCKRLRNVQALRELNHALKLEF